jgi:hypothetical protein
MFVLLQESEDITTSIASKAVPNPFLAVYVERWSIVFVKGAMACELISAGREVYVPAYELN